MPVMVLLLGVVGCSSSSSSGTPYAANDAALAALTVGSETLNPAFDSEIVSYAVTVANGTTTFQVTPTARNPRAYMIQVKKGTGAFVAVPSGTPSPAYAAPAVGSSTSITIRVIAEDQVATKAYVLTVTQKPPKSSDATLGSLALNSKGSGTDLLSSFDPATTGYAVTLPNATLKFTVTPTVNEPHAIVEVKQDGGSFATVASGTASGDLDAPAADGTTPTTITLRVTAENGTVKLYTITVQRSAALSADARLESVSINPGGPIPAFASATTSYAVTLPYGTGTFTVTPSAVDGAATIKVAKDSQAPADFVTVASGSASASLTAPPADGTSTTIIYVHVIAQNQTDTNDYTITVSQAQASTIATLRSLSVSPGSLSTTFDPDSFVYTTILPYGTASITVTPTATDAATETIEVDDGHGSFSPVQSGSGATLTVPAAVDSPTTFTVRVTAQDASTQNFYTIVVSAPQEVFALFPLQDNVTLFTPTGDVSGVQTFAPGVVGPPATGMALDVYKNGATIASPPTQWHDPTGVGTPASQLLQRSQITGGSWPTDTDMVADRWVQFAVSTSATKILTVDSITCWAGSGGGANLRYRVWFSTTGDFTSGAVELSDISWASSTPAPTKNDMYFRTAAPSIVVQPGGTLYVRFYPWQTGSTSGKYLLLKSFQVHGAVQ
jgi:hypothetical protein